MTKTIKLDYITKIEGHAKLHIRIEKNKVTDVSLQIFEGSRYFEGMLKDKKYDDMSPISSRICGICSVVHALTSLKAVESAFNVQITEQTQLLREILHLGGIIQSHVLHLYFLTLPDYHGFPNAVVMASKHPNQVKRALDIKKLGNRIAWTIGGRDVHPIASVVGGFSRTPEKAKMDMLLKELKAQRANAIKTINLFSSFDYPKLDRDCTYFALTGKHYNLLNGEISGLNNKGVCFIPVQDYRRHFKEYFQAGSTAEFVVSEGNSYMVGALARLNHNFQQLPKEIQGTITFDLPAHSPYVNNAAQAIEILYSIDRCIEIIEKLKLRDEKPVEIKVAESRGIAVSEAPRGLVFHDYTFDKKGFCKRANIITPTSQNLRRMEEDIKLYLPQILNRNESEIRLELEKLIRAYDPCISCSTHFLDIVWEKVR